jgi:hypothetical protein
MAHEQRAAATSPGPSTVPVLSSNVMCVVLLGDRAAIDVRGDAGHGQGRTDRVRQDLPGALLSSDCILHPRFQKFSGAVPMLHPPYRRMC